MSDRTVYAVVSSPVGELTLAGDGEALVGLYLPTARGEARPGAGWQRDDAAFRQAREQLAAYFAGERTEFDLALRPEGSAFQRGAWDVLCGIPFGATISYGEQARRLGRPLAARAVGAANGRNPLAIVVPCHRVIGAGGGLTGYGGGLPVKEWLLRHEAAVLAARGLRVPSPRRLAPATS